MGMDETGKIFLKIRKLTRAKDSHGSKTKGPVHFTDLPSCLTAIFKQDAVEVILISERIFQASQTVTISVFQLRIKKKANVTSLFPFSSEFICKFFFTSWKKILPFPNHTPLPPI